MRLQLWLVWIYGQFYKFPSIIRLKFSFYLSTNLESETRLENILFSWAATFFVVWSLCSQDRFFKRLDLQFRISVLFHEHLTCLVVDSVCVHTYEWGRVKTTRVQFYGFPFSQKVEKIWFFLLFRETYFEKYSSKNPSLYHKVDWQYDSLSS